MSRAFYVLGFIIAAACFVGVVDRNSSEVTHQAAMEAPRPIFESQAELRHLTMPCAYIQHKRFEHERVAATNTRCVKADGSDR